MTFENTYRNFSFWPLVDLALRAARAVKALTGDRIDRGAGLAAGQRAG